MLGGASVQKCFVSMNKTERHPDFWNVMTEFCLPSKSFATVMIVIKVCCLDSTYRFS